MLKRIALTIGLPLVVAAAVIGFIHWSSRPPVNTAANFGVFVGFLAADKGDILLLENNDPCLVLGKPRDTLFSTDDIRTKWLSLSCEPGRESRTYEVDDLLPFARRVVSPIESDYPTWAAFYTAKGRGERLD